MLTYEQITDSFIAAARIAGLDPYLIEHNIETRSLDREFRCLCVPKGIKPPHEIRAEINFGWDCAMTTETIFDDHAPDMDDEEEAESCFIELIIKYNFKLPGFDSINDADKELRKLFGQVMKHDNIPHIHCEIIVDGEDKGLLECWAEHFWEVSYLEEPSDFPAICAEIYRVLKEMRKIPLLKHKQKPPA
jgi:hypothetical protein